MISWNTHVAKLYNISQMQPNNTTLQPKVSIVIPVYKAEKYIGRCVRTLFSQTLDSLEYIFVDDCSPDDSIGVMTDILEEYPERKQQVKIIRHEENTGVGQSRQDGVDAATGEYIIHCDPDDWVEPDMYEQLFQRAMETDADMVYCDYFMETNGTSRLISQSIESYDNNFLIFALCSGRLYGSCWNKLVSRDFIIRNNVSFIKGLNVCEDLFFFIQLLKKGMSVEYIDKALYHYDFYINPNSIQRTSLPNHILQDEQIILLSHKYLDTESYDSARQALISGALFHIFIVSPDQDSVFIKRYRRYYNEVSAKRYLSLQNWILLSIAFRFSKTFAQKLMCFLKRLKHRII